jgi:hypothetical protein
MRRLVLLLSGVIGLALFTSGCEIPDYAGLLAFDVQTNLLAVLTRSDGSKIPDLSAVIERKYGFRAQTMNFVVPKLTVSVTSSAGEMNPDNFTSKVIVSDWSTQTGQVINDAQALPFTLHINGIGPASCGTDVSQECPIITLADAYADYFAAQATAGLQDNLSLRIIGADANGASQIRDLAPSAVIYSCVVDKTELSKMSSKSPGVDFNEDYSKAIQCSGKVVFYLD